MFVLSQTYFILLELSSHSQKCPYILIKSTNDTFFLSFIFQMYGITPGQNLSFVKSSKKQFLTDFHLNFFVLSTPVIK
jgi:hypothetical protein